MYRLESIEFGSMTFKKHKHNKMKKIILTIALALAVNIVNAQDLFGAARENNITQIEQLINAGQDVNQANQRGFTPLILAVYSNNKEAVQLLLEKGANPNAQDLSGNNALMGAAFRGYPEMAEILIANKADVNQVNFNGASPLIFAVTFGQNDIAKILLDAKADTSIKDNSGKTAKDHALLQENKEMIELLSTK